MQILNDLYDQKTLLKMNAAVADALKAMRKVKLLKFIMALFAIGLLLIVWLETHLIRALFSELVEDTESTFTPGVMALTSLAMILGFHVMAEQAPNHKAVRFIRACPRLFIPVYLIGLSMMIGGLIYDRGPLSLLSESGDWDFSAAASALPEEWTSVFIEQIANPVAALAFSLGIGGLAVVNIFAADFLIQKIQNAALECEHILQQAGAIRGDYEIVLQGMQAYRSIDFELAELAHLDHETLKERQALEALNIIHDELIKPKRFLTNAEHQQPDNPFLEAGEPKPDLKSLKTSIARIDAIDLEAVLQWMASPKTTSAPSKRT